MKMRSLGLALLVSQALGFAFLYDNENCKCLSPCDKASAFIGSCFVSSDCPDSFEYEVDGMLLGHKRICDPVLDGDGCNDGEVSKCLNNLPRTFQTGNEADLVKGMCSCYDQNCAGNWEASEYDGERTTGEVLQETILAKTGVNQTCKELLKSPPCHITCEGEDCGEIVIVDNSVSFRGKNAVNGIRATLTFQEDCFYKYTKLYTGGGSSFNDYLKHEYCANWDGVSCSTINVCPNAFDCLTSSSGYYAGPRPAKKGDQIQMIRQASTVREADWAFTAFQRCRIDCTGKSCKNIDVDEREDMNGEDTLWARGTTVVKNENYEADEQATMTFSRDGFVTFTKLDTEKSIIAHDYLQYDNGVPIGGQTIPKGFAVKKGKSMTWYSDLKTQLEGWEFRYTCDLDQSTD